MQAASNQSKIQILLLSCFQLILKPYYLLPVQVMHVMGSFPHLRLSKISVLITGCHYRIENEDGYTVSCDL